MARSGTTIVIPPSHGRPIISVCSYPFDADLTNDAATTAEIDMRPFSHGTVQNVTGSAVTVTYYAAGLAQGTAYALYDQDGVAVTQTLASASITELPSAVAGVSFLVPVSDAATDTLTFVLKR